MILIENLLILFFKFLDFNLIVTFISLVQATFAYLIITNHKTINAKSKGKKLGLITMHILSNVLYIYNRKKPIIPETMSYRRLLVGLVEVEVMVVVIEVAMYSLAACQLILTAGDPRLYSRSYTRI